MTYFKKQGYSLLELMLALAVGSLILVVSVRYYMSAHNHEEVSAAIAQIKKVTKASYQWLALQNQTNFSAATSPNGAAGTAITITLLQNNNLISANETSTAWGGTVSVAPGLDPNTVRISLSGMSATNCKQLVLAMAKNTQTELPISSCTGSNITYYGDF